ncbi:MAG: RluA family pseudouridine synthase [Oscillospiraceae bacterium]|nr:RluA family pseudouridine synthase [Oscillospiraceae bacterium]
MRDIIINENDSGQRLDRFLAKAFPNLSQGIVRSALRKNRIKLNGKKPADLSVHLVKDDVLRLYMDELINNNSEKFKQLSYEIPRELNLIYEDENILIIDKPPGLPVHEDNENTPDTLINRVLLYLEEKGEYKPENEHSFRPSLCNRIDRNTGGIVLAAKNAKSLRILSQKLKDREMTKLYLCAVHGTLIKKADMLTAFLEKFPKQNKVKITHKKTPNSKTIKTAYRVIDTCKNMSLLEVNLLTGRTHQIRKHLAMARHPVVGDTQHGHKSFPDPRLAGLTYPLLHAAEIEMTHPLDSLKILKAFSPVPQDFHKWLLVLGLERPRRI